MTLLSVPVIDVAPFAGGSRGDKAAVASAVDEALGDIGFLVITGHGVPAGLLEAMHRVSRAFFDLPMEEKREVLRPAPDVSRGYVAMEGESIGRSRDEMADAGDLNESFMVGPIEVPDPAYAFAEAAGNHFAPNRWPRRPGELEEVYRAYYQAMSRLAGSLMAIFATALGLDEAYFEDKIDRHISRLRVRNYPAPAVPAQPGQLRAGAHSDYGSITILATEDRPGGLQVCNAVGEWVDVPIVPGCYIVNIGDLMARWTNDRWVSTLHRVVNPEQSRWDQSRRQSIIFFHNPNYDAEIACLETCLGEGESARYEPTTSGDHLRRLFVATQNA